MLNRIFLGTAAGLIAAPLLLSPALASTPTAEATVQAADNSGPVMWVDPPNPNRQPITVAIPLSGQSFKPVVQQSQKSASPTP